MLRITSVLFLVAASSVPASAATVTIEKVARSVGNSIYSRDLALTDAVPGRADPFVFWSSASPSAPVINDAGEVAFVGFSASKFGVNQPGGGFGIYVKRPGQPLAVLVDTTIDGAGDLTSSVPGHPGSVFFGYEAPLLNNAGDILFFGRFYDSVTFAQGAGFFSTTTTGGPIVKIVDTFDTPAGHSATSLFESFTFTVDAPSTFGASLNDSGQVVYWGQFCDAPPCTSLGRLNGIFGTTVSGATHVLLADSAKSICPSGVPFGLSCDGALDEGFWEIRPEIALSSTGVVAFHGSIRQSLPSTCCKGTYAIPVTGGVATTVAFQFETAPPASVGAPASTYQARFDDNDINGAGDYLFLPLLSAPCCQQKFGLFSGDQFGGPQGNVVDTLVGNGLAVPGEIAGAEFATFAMASMNESGQLGFYGVVRNGAIANNNGIYATDVSGGPITLIMDGASLPPGQPAGAKITTFQGRSAAIDDNGNMVFWGIGVRPDTGGGLASLWGMYYYDACSDEVLRIVDDTTSVAELGLDFNGLPGTPRFGLFQSGEARSGHYRSINNNGDVAFLTKSSNFGWGIHIAHVQTAGGGGLIDLTCPPDLVATTAIECGGDTSPAAAGSATAVDGCTGTAIATTSTDVSVSACGGTETITRTWTADSASCVQLITTVDSVLPSLSVPMDVTVGCGDSTDPTNTGQATVGDACDVAPGLTYTDSAVAGACGQSNTITRTWTATDACGNSTSLDQTITITDTTAPVLTVPADVQVACDASTDASLTGQATATDNCDPAPTVTSSDVASAGSCPQNSVVTRTWTATDACGNAFSADQIITLADNTAPTLTVPAAATVECDADSSPTATGVATATDTCDGAPSVTSSDITAAGACPQASQITRTWSATDACANGSAADQSVSVVDTTAPVITLNGAAAIVLAGCVGEAYIEQGASATDNCDVAAIAVSVGGDVVNTAVLGTYVVAYSAQDACANAATVVTRTVDVLDTTAPAFTSLPADLTVECEGGLGVPATNANIVAFLNTAAASDACDPIVGVTNDAPADFPIGDTTVTWTATDAANNTFSATRVVHVVDTVSPVVICPAGTTAAADVNCQATVLDVTGGVVASDTCADALALTITQAPPAGSLLALGTHAITVTAADPNGNSAQCTTTLTVADVAAPALTVPVDIAIECDASSDPSATGQATAGDNCDPAPSVTFSDSATAGVCPDLTVLARQWTASDASGNTSIGDQTITLQDTTGPSVACPADIATSGGFGGTVVAFEASASDACDPNPSVAAVPPSGSFFATGVTPVSATAADTCGNASSACSFDVLVSCFGANRAKIGTKDVACRGIEEIEFTSMNGTEELISLFKAEEHSGGDEEDTLPPSIVVDDGVNGPVTVDTSCGTTISVGDVFGPYTVSDVEKDFDDHDDDHGNKVELRGSFVPAVAYDLAIDDFVISVDDGQGNVAVFTIPAGSFQIHGNPSKGKYKFEGTIGVARVEAKLEGCSYKFEIENAPNTGQLLGTTMTIGFAVGPNVAEQTLIMENKGNHLKFKGEPKVNCCPDCEGIASMQVTSDQGVLVFEPDAGDTELPANTVVDDGVNGAVTIHTSCSQPLAVGDQMGAYTISEVIRVYDLDD